MGQCNCSLNATKSTAAELKRILEGTPRLLVHRDPEVYVTIEDMKGGSVSFSEGKFSLEGLDFQIFLEVRGSPGEIAKSAAGKAMDKMGMEKPKEVLKDAKQNAKEAVLATPMVGELVGKAMHAVSRAKDDLDIHSHTIRIACTVDVCKEFGDEEVEVTLRGFKTDQQLINKVLCSDTTRHFIERAISHKVSESLTRKQRRVNERFNNLGDAVESGGSGVLRVVREAGNAVEKGGNGVRERLLEVGNAVEKKRSEVQEKLMGSNSNSDK